MDRPRSSAEQSGTLRQLLPVAAVLLLCLAFSAAVLVYGAQAGAEQEARRYGQSLARSTAILIQPLLLADDRISLNYLFNELNAQPRINGLHLTDARKLPVAVAGEQRGLEQTLELARGDESLGELTLWIDSDYGWLLLKQQLLEAGALALISILAALFTLWLRLRRPASPAAPAADFLQVASAVSPAFAAPTPAAPATETAAETAAETDEDPDALPSFDEMSFADMSIEEVNEEPGRQASETRIIAEEYEPPTLTDSADEIPLRQPASDLDEAFDEGLEAEPEEQPDEEHEEVARFFRPDEQEPEPHPVDDIGLAPHVDTWLRSPMSLDIDEQAPPGLTADRDDEHADPEPFTTVDSDRDLERKADRDDNRELVELLRPSRTQERMPPFTPSVDRYPDDDEAIAPEIEDTDQVEFDDGTDTPAEPARPRLSIVPPLGAQEEQLGLYTLEHELELMLGADEAGYLFLIDAGCARSDNLEEEERIQLMKPYRTLANSVAHIYGGRVEPTPEGDLRLFFDTPKPNDEHGINALCASMLFTNLYRHYNQQRIRRFKPVINLHLALVRGHHRKLERMLEEARFLTHTTESNELITHTALTEAPDLKATLLEGADIRREDEDKVLLIRIAKSYQELLEKQARHLLAKLQSREEQAGN